MEFIGNVQPFVVGSGTVMNLGSDATGDMYYTDADGFMQRLPAPPVEGDFVLHHNGTTPVWQQVAEMGALVVESEDGTLQGDTLITVTPGTGTLFYKLGTAAQTVYYNQVISGWTAITSPDDITATTGQVITVVDVDDENRAFAIGTATVDSNDILGSITVTSEDGTAQGDTKITADPATGTLLYKITAEAEDPDTWDELDGTWLAFTSEDDYTATTGEFFNVCEVNAENLVLAFGYDEIDSNDVAGSITVTSIAGTEVGDTNVTADPATGTLVYKIAAAAQTPDTWDVLDETWLAFTSGEDYTATTGDYITVCEVNEDDEMIAIGSAEIVSKAEE